jgi:hypothetical protein
MRRRAVVGTLLIVTITIAWTAQSALSTSPSQMWPWLAGDCHGMPGGILEDQVIHADRGAKLCIVPPSYLCVRSAGPPLRWYVDIEVGGETFYGSGDPATRHCVTVSNQPVIVQSSTYCTTFATRYSGSISFSPFVRESGADQQTERID